MAKPKDVTVICVCVRRRWGFLCCKIRVHRYSILKGRKICWLIFCLLLFPRSGWNDFERQFHIKLAPCLSSPLNSSLLISSIPYSMLLNFTKNFQFSAIFCCWNFSRYLNLERNVLVFNIVSFFPIGGRFISMRSQMKISKCTVHIISRKVIFFSLYNL